MRILIVAQYYAPDITAAAFRISETAELLAARGHEVAVVTAEPHRVQAAPANRVADPGSAALGAGPAVHRVPIAPLQGSGLKPYLAHYFSFVFGARRTAREIIGSRFVPEVIWVSSPPLFVGLVGPGLRRRASRAARRAARKAARGYNNGAAPRFVLDIRDIWPDTAVAAGQISREGRAYTVGRLMEKWLYRRADGLSCVASPMGEYLREATKRSKPVSVVYNGVSADSLGPRAEDSRPPAGTGAERSDDPAPLAPDPGPTAGVSPGEEVAATAAEANAAHPPDSRRKEILYAGNWGRLQGLDTLIRAWAELSGEPFYKEWRLRLVGSGVMEEELRRLAAELGLTDRVVMEPPVAKSRAMELMEAAGLLFLNLRPDEVFHYTIPSKLFDYLRAGRPILGGIPGEGAEILAETGGNVTFAPSDPDALRAALRRVADEYPQLQERAKGNVELVRERFTREKATQELEGLFGILR